MGLNTSHEAWHGPYSSFNDFRRWLALQIGLDLSDYIGFGKFENGNYVETGTKEPSTIQHDIMPLLNHSDCDGILTPDECRQIARGLKSIIDKFPKETHHTMMIEWANQFRAGCIRAANAKEHLDFH